MHMAIIYTKKLYRANYIYYIMRFSTPILASDTYVWFRLYLQLISYSMYVYW